jgi:hypothetical protein
MRKSDVRTISPSLAGGTQGTMGGKTDTASKDSLIGTNTVKEYVPGKLTMGAGAPGGKGQRS